MSRGSRSARLLAAALLALLPGGPSAPARGPGGSAGPRGTTAAVANDNLWLQKETGCLRMAGWLPPARDLLSASSTSDDRWSHSLFALIPSWTKKILSRRESSTSHQLTEDVSKMPVSSGFGVTLHKCAVVDIQHDPQTAHIRLLINNTNTLLSANITDLILQDNITGLRVQKNSGNRTADGIQIYRKRFLQVGEYFAINYTALLDGKEMRNGRVLTLPAKLTFRSSSLNKTQLVSVDTSLTITEEEKTKISYSHGIHAAGFFIAFLVSFILTCVVLCIVYRTQILKWRFCNKTQEPHPERCQNHKLEPSQFNSGDLFSEDLIMNDQFIDILSFEDTEHMLQALEEPHGGTGPIRSWLRAPGAAGSIMRTPARSTGCPVAAAAANDPAQRQRARLLLQRSAGNSLEVTSLTRADADLEAYRVQMCKEVIAMMMKNMVFNHSLFPHVEKRMSSVFKKQFLAMEKEIQEEYERKMVALTAECNLETRKKMETQHQKERAANEEAEELMKKVNEKPAVEYRNLLDRLHRLEQDHLKRFLLVKQEEYFAKAYRQLAISRRKELHNIFFTQITNAIFKGDLKLEAAKILVQDYSKIQGDIEELMDFLQASKKYHLNRRFAYREYLINRIQLWDSQASALINAAASQISSLVNKMERAGHLSESHLGMLLDQAQAEINSVKQKFDHDLKQEKQKLHQKLIIKRRREILQKQKEHRKEQLSLGDTFKTTQEVIQYINHWKSLLSDHTVEVEELMEKLDSEASEELRELMFSLMERTAEELKRIQCVLFVQELLRLNVLKVFLLEAVEEHKKEIIGKREQLDREEYEKTIAMEELLVLTRQKLSQELENDLSEQKKLRTWEQQLLSLPLSLSEEELFKIRQEFHCCFTQMDSSLSLPRIRARTLLQAFESAWREAELLKVDQRIAMTSKQQHSKMKKAGSRNRNKIDILKKSLEEKIFIYENSVREETLNKVEYELQLEREYQLRALENKFGEYIAALQFQKTIKKSRTLERHRAIMNIQALLFEQLTTSKTLSKLECIQILEAHNPEIEDIERKLEYEILNKESAQQQQHLTSRKRGAPDGLGLSSEAVETNADRQVTLLLRQALSKCGQFINLHQQSLREEQENYVVLEDLLENLETDAFLALYSQELRLTGYLARLTRVPMGMLHRILNLLLPSSSQSEILSVLNSINKYSDGVAEIDSNAEESVSCRKRKQQGLWQALESKVKQDLINRSLEKTSPLNRRKDSLIKKKQLAFLEKASFIPHERSPRHHVEQPGPPSPLTVMTAEAIELLDTGEKVFLFREQSDPVPMFPNPPKKKKKNFLNSKKATRASVN